MGNIPDKHIKLWTHSKYSSERFCKVFGRILPKFLFLKWYFCHFTPIRIVRCSRRWIRNKDMEMLRRTYTRFQPSRREIIAPISESESESSSAAVQPMRCVGIMNETEESERAATRSGMNLCFQWKDSKSGLCLSVVAEERFRRWLFVVLVE